MFKDLSGKEWFYNALKRVAKYNLLSGFPDGTFRPKEPVLREQQASILDRLLHEPALRLAMRKARLNLVKKLTPSSVKILATDKNGRTALGSGVVLDKQGHIATNVHVVGGLEVAPLIQVYIGDLPPFRAAVRRGNLFQDVAVLKIDGVPEKYLYPVKFAEEVLWLEDVIIIGNPLGYLNTATVGIVSFEKRIRSNGSEWIQTDCAINPGNSGGGAFNLKGELIGLACWKIVWVDEEKTAAVDNMGFLVPFWHVKNEYEEALRIGARTVITGDSLEMEFGIEEFEEFR